MRDQYVRDVTFLDIVLHPDPQNAPHKTMSEMIDHVEKMLKDPEIQQWTKSRKRKCYIRRMQKESDRVYMLLYFTDSEDPDAAFSHMQTDSQREEQKGPGEGRPESAHVIIYFNPENVDEYRYPAILEKSNKINRARFEKYINYIFRKVSVKYNNKFKCSDPSGEKDNRGKTKKRRYEIKADVQGHMSDEFQDMVNNGKLRGIYLETEKSVHVGTGEEKYVVPRREIIKMGPKTEWKKNPWKKINESIRIGRDNNLEKAKIYIEDEDKKSHSMDIDTQTRGVSGEGFLKTARLRDFGKLLPEAHTELDEEMLEKMEEKSE